MGAVCVIGTGCQQDVLLRGSVETINANLWPKAGNSFKYIIFQAHTEHR